MKRGNEQSWWCVLTAGKPREDLECKVGKQESQTLTQGEDKCESDLNKRKSVRKLGVGLFGHSFCYSRHSLLTLKGIIYWKEI